MNATLRLPVKPDLEVAIIGSGFAGLGMGIQLKKEGRQNFRIFEKDTGVGGTWRVNHYPGCACDVPSPLYSFSFEPNPDWSRMYSAQPEILKYLEHCTAKHALLDQCVFGHELTSAEFDEANGFWKLTFNGAKVVTAKVVVSGLGGLSRPSTPHLKGLERFKGTTFHSAQWNHGFDFEGKKVAVIGTGASAIQFVPQVAPKVAKLSLFQRTPPWILPKPDKEFGPLRKALYRKIPLLQAGLRALIYWTHELRVLGFVVHPRLLKAGEWLGRRHIAKQLKDPALRAKVTPDYSLGCKRVLISNDYYPALARPNVELVTDGIREVTEKGIVTDDGREHEVDAIIFGTGFKASELLTPLSIRGLGGVDINDAWKDGISAYKGTTVAGFPNFFMMTGPNTGLGHNSMVYMIESQLAYVTDALRKLDEQQLQWVDVQPDAQSRFNARIQGQLKGAVWASGCKSWYVDAHGTNVTLWPGFTFDFRRETAHFDLENYRVRERAPAWNKQGVAA